MPITTARGTGRAVAAYRRARRWIEAVLGAYFCFAGYKILIWRSE